MSSDSDIIRSLGAELKSAAQIQVNSELSSDLQNSLVWANLAIPLVKYLYPHATDDVNALNLKAASDIYVNFDGPNGDSNLYFYDGASSTGQYIKWDDSETRIGFSSNVYYNGDITATWGLEGGVLKGGKGLWGQGNILADGDLYANFSGPNGNSFVYFYNTGTTGASLKFDNTAQEFVFSHALQEHELTIIALYPNTRIGDWAFVTTDEYLNETTTATTTKDTYIYINMSKYITSIHLEGFISITGV